LSEHDLGSRNVMQQTRGKFQGSLEFGLASRWGLYVSQIPWDARQYLCNLYKFLISFI